MELTKSEKAIKHILNRVVESRNYSWYMWGTESLSLCLEAEAERRGITRDELQAEIHKRSVDLDQHYNETDREERTEAEVVVLRRRVEELENQLAQAGNPDIIEVTCCRCESMLDDWEANQRVESLLRDADGGLIELTTDRLRSALAGEWVF